MTSLTLGGLVFICLFGAASIAMPMQSRLPKGHLSLESREAIKLATAIVGTLAALALGLLIASAKTSYDNAEAALRDSVARVVLLDRSLAHYGPETAPARAELRALIERRLERPWAETDDDESSAKDALLDRGIEPVQQAIHSLHPANDTQTWLKTHSLEISSAIAEARWMVTETRLEGLPGPFLAVMVFWLSLLFATFGLLAPTNGTVVLTIMVCALSVAGAIFLVVDMAHPYRGLIAISDEPLRAALVELGH